MPTADEIEDLIAGAALELAEAILGRELSRPGEPRPRDALRRALALAPAATAR